MQVISVCVEISVNEIKSPFGGRLTKATAVLGGLCFDDTSGIVYEVFFLLSQLNNDSQSLTYHLHHQKMELSCIRPRVSHSQAPQPT